MRVSVRSVPRRPAAGGWRRHVQHPDLPGGHRIARDEGDPKAAAQRDGSWLGQGVLAPREAFGRGPVPMRAPQLVRAIDGRPEQEPRPVGAPRDARGRDPGEVRVHARRGIQGVVADQLGAPALTLGVEHPHARRGRVRLPEPMTGRGDGGAIRRPRRLLERPLAAATADAPDRAALRAHDVQVRSPRQVRIGVPVGGERDARAIRAPRWLAVMRRARREAPQRAIGHVRPSTGSGPGRRCSPCRSSGTAAGR